MTQIDNFAINLLRNFSVGFFDNETAYGMAEFGSSKNPPHNIIKVDEKTHILELALAGYDRKDITIEQRDKYLVISGKTSSEEKNYVYKGITGKEFCKSYLLGNYKKVKSATMKDGLLTVIIENDEEKITKIDIV